MSDTYSVNDLVFVQYDRVNWTLGYIHKRSVDMLYWWHIRWPDGTIANLIVPERHIRHATPEEKARHLLVQ